MGLRFGVWGLGFRVWGLGFGVYGLGSGVWGFGVWGLGFGVMVEGGKKRFYRALQVLLQGIMGFQWFTVLQGC